MEVSSNFVCYYQLCVQNNNGLCNCMQHVMLKHQTHFAITLISPFYLINAMYQKSSGFNRLDIDSSLVSSVKQTTHKYKIPSLGKIWFYQIVRSTRTPFDVAQSQCQSHCKLVLWAWTVYSICKSVVQKSFDLMQNLFTIITIMTHFQV